MQDVADKHRAVPAAADDLQAVIAELNAGHPARVAPQRALLLNPALWLALAWASTEATKQTILWAAVPARPL